MQVRLPVINDVYRRVFSAVISSGSVSLLRVRCRAVLALGFVVRDRLMIRLHVLALAVFTKLLRRGGLAELVR